MSAFAAGPVGAGGAPVVVPGGVDGTPGDFPGEGTWDPAGGAEIPPVRAGSTTGVTAGADDPPEGGAVPPVELSARAGAAGVSPSSRSATAAARLGLRGHTRVAPRLLLDLDGRRLDPG